MYAHKYPLRRPLNRGVAEHRVSSRRVWEWWESSSDAVDDQDGRMWTPIEGDAGVVQLQVPSSCRKWMTYAPNLKAYIAPVSLMSLFPTGFSS